MARPADDRLPARDPAVVSDGPCQSERHVSDLVLTAGELNRALLARQLLLERSSLSVPRALEAVGGLQTQYAPAGYVGLWSRLRNFRRDALKFRYQEHTSA